MRFYAHRILVTFIVPKSSKVGIHKAVELEIVARFKGQPIFFNALQVTTYVLNIILMNCTWVASESSTLVN
jgi:hypothetical protein